MPTTIQKIKKYSERTQFIIAVISIPIAFILLLYLLYYQITSKDEIEADKKENRNEGFRILGGIAIVLTLLFFIPSVIVFIINKINV